VVEVKFSTFALDGHAFSDAHAARLRLETRETVLGYIQRGGTPSPMDRVLATRYGAAAADMIANRNFGRMVALRDDKIESVPLQDVAGKLKLVDPANPLVTQARNMGTSFGN
jgi:6-phosphofructokinase 1